MTGWEASAERIADLFGRAFVVGLLFVGAVVVVFGAGAAVGWWRARG